MRLQFEHFFITGLLLLIFSPLNHVFADDEEKLANIFIHTDPINASIILDGEPILQESPALIRNLTIGTHTIGVIKEGFLPVDVSIKIEQPGTTLVEISPDNGKVFVTFPNMGKVAFSNGKVKTEQSNSLLIPQGNYIVTNSEDVVTLKPVYDKEIFFYFSTGFFILSTGAAIVSSIFEFNDQGELFYPHSTALTVFESMAIVSGLTEMALIFDRSSFLNDRKAVNYYGESERPEQKIFNKALEDFSKYEMEKALTGFSSIISEYPDYKKFPEALYTIARIHLIKGDSNLAASELRIILNNFPDATVYDKSCQKLSIIYYKNDQKEKSLETAKKMVFYDKIFEHIPEEIANTSLEAVVRSWAGISLEGDAK